MRRAGRLREVEPHVGGAVDGELADARGAAGEGAGLVLGGRRRACRRCASDRSRAARPCRTRSPACRSWCRHCGSVLQPGLLQSMPPWPSSQVMRHVASSVQNGSLAHAGSAQSMRPLSSSSMPLSQISWPGLWQCGSLSQRGSVHGMVDATLRVATSLPRMSPPRMSLPRMSAPRMSARMSAPRMSRSRMSFGPHVERHVAPHVAPRHVGDAVRAGGTVAAADADERRATAADERQRARARTRRSPQNRALAALCAYCASAERITTAWAGRRRGRCRGRRPDRRRRR